MAGKEPDIGPTARTVAENVRRLRDLQGMNYTQLSERLRKAANWSINAVGIRRIESGERRVTADDLMALSVALGVSPVTLLYPTKAPSADELLDVTGLEPQTARVVWEWTTASQWAFWAVERGGAFDVPSNFFRRTWPQWLLDAEGTKGLLELIDATWAEAREKARQQLMDGGRDGDDQ